MTDLTDRLAGLSPAKREILARRLAQRRAEDAGSSPIGRRKDRASLPLSFAQERQWFLDRLLPGSPLYTMAGAVRMLGYLDEGVLARSMNEIVRRHEVLRTTFTAVEGRPVAVLAPTLELVPHRIDLRDLPTAEREAAAQRLIAEEVRRPFDLETGPLIRLTLLRLADEETVGLLTMHHIVSDGWSTGVLFREFVAIYQALAADQPAPLAELPIQYADYAAWQRQRLQGELLETQLAYWREQLSGCAPLLDMPTDRPRPALPSFGGARLPLTLPPELTAALQELSRREGVTLFMTLLAGFKALLFRYTGQGDLVVGVPVAERSQAEVAGLIGCFLNMLPIRAGLGANPSFRELLRRVQQTALAAYARQDLPFEKLVDELQLERSLSHAPLCQAAFSFEENPAGSLWLQNLTMQFEEIDTGMAKLDLALELTETRAAGHPLQLDGWLEYSTDLFDRETVARLGGHLLTLLEAAVADPDQPIGALALLTPAERRQILVEWNATDTPYPQDRCIHELFEGQVARTPDAVAVAYGEARLSYHELNERANRLAHHLRELGVGPETLVGLCMERSLEAVVGILGILKAGGAYLPLDPAYPYERLVQMLADSGAPLLLTVTPAGQPPHALAAAGEDRWRVVDLNADRERIGEASPDNPCGGATAGSLAYVIYTSGSTGTPKGVMVQHRELVQHTLAFVESHELDASDRVMLFVSLSFDAAAAVLYPPLLIGATFVIPSIPSAELSGPTLARFCERERVTVMHLPASFWHQWVDDLCARGEPFRAPLKVLLTGGERPALAKLRAWAELVQRPMIFLNAYGPTEAVITTTLYKLRCTQEALAGLTRIPSGRPIANKRVYLLDARMQPVPVGVTGEVYVGGVGLARGYLNRPELTTAAFVCDPFQPDGQGRLYRTGDLARYLPDGCIEFVGRADGQVKLRGFRIELGEITAALAGHPAVREAAVVVREDGPGGKGLVAYVVPAPYAGHQEEAGAPGPLAAELRIFLAQRLPAHMLPAAFMTIAALPLTANGKVDEQALPALDQTGAPARAYTVPQTPTERALSQIWAELLGVEQVGAEDSFFDLGGHSLLATQLMSRIRAAFQIDLPLRRLFEGATVAGLARAVEAARGAESVALTSPITPMPREGVLPLSFAQQRLWFLSQLEPDSPFYNTPAAVRLEGQLDVAALERSLNAIISRHEALRTTFQASAGQPAQVIAPPRPAVLPLYDLSALPAAEQATRLRQLIAEEAARPFDLLRGPLIRTSLVHLGEQEHIFLLNLHHIVSDDWSTGVFVRELGALYQAFAAGLPSPLAELPIQYADFALWQREWLQGAVLDEQLAYWKEQLSGDLPALDLPADRKRPPVQTYRGGRWSFALDRGLSLDLAELSRREGATLFMTVLAAFKTLLYRYTGQTDVLVGSPIAGRNRGEIEPLIGFFLNTLVLRSDLAANPTFRTLLDRVREVTLGAYAHQDLPFERLVEELQPARDLSRPPLFQVMCVLHNAPAATLEVPDLTLSPIEVPRETALFDLTLSLTETEQGLTGWWEYNRDLFDEATVARMHGHFQRLLAGVITDPGQRLDDLPLLGEAERCELLAQGCAAPSVYPRDLCFHELFEAQARRTPEVTAAVFEGRALTYGELNRRANQLARHLRGLGVGPESLVGICVERSLEMLVGLLGILKAGGAYVPLDPAFPRERLAYMLEHSQAMVLVTQAALRDVLPEHQVPMVCLDASWDMIGQEDTADLDAGATPENLAYVLYTSGSTGKPKGVQIAHRALVNFLWSMREQPGIGAADRLLAVTTLSFDIAGLELYLPLLVGARVVLASRAAAADGRRLSQLIADEGATIMQATPATWRLLLEAGWPGDPGLTILCGGEALPRELADRLLARGAAVWNLYGPTETTIWSTIARVAPGDEAVPIGRPIANTQLYVLDAAMRPTPAGVPGELYIGGDGVARGYLHNAELTAARFVSNPFAGSPRAAEGTLYRTGDLVRSRPDGTLEFLSRADFQVKIRGFRIEIGEIEAALARHPAVRQCAVVARDRGRASGSDLVLVAYIVPAPGEAPSVEELRRGLKEQLPDYMLPSAFVTMAEFPLTPNGKLDRKALPTPEGLRPELEAAYVSPRSSLERVIAEVWQAVLQVERVGVDDNFFDLGGHSLLLAQVHSHLREALGRELTMLDLFKHPTIGALARHLSQGEAHPAEEPGAARAALRRKLSQQAGREVAIIGMTGRFPGAASVEAFWHNLCEGIESIRFYSEEELLAAGVAPELLRNPSYVRANANLDDVETFDAGVFGMTPKEVAIMDPQHRLFLECAWEALERAGYDAERYQGRVGVFAGVSLNTYLLANLAPNWAELMRDTGFHQLFVANDKDFAPTRVSYKLNLRGPSLTVQTACSTSLVAVHEACQSLLSGECDMALAGGAMVKVPQHEGYLYQEGGIASPDGHCRAFDASASGTTRGDGVAVIALKRLKDALADGDQIYAVIKGSAINNDGANKVGYTAPSVDGQAEVIAEALAVAGVEPATIGYVEAHGTGTPLGDPIEVAALTQAYGSRTIERGFCALGSVKTNIGHLDTAAGAAGLIKAALALQHGLIPPSLNFTQPNPKIDFAGSPFVVNAELRPWHADGPRRAGVSSFGIGGTNAHVILEQAPERKPSALARPWQLLTLSAKTASALDAMTDNLARHLEARPDANLADVAFTLQAGRRVFEHRRALVCRDVADAVAALTQRDPARLLSGASQGQARPVIFMFSGQGAQYVSMGHGLYTSEPVFREHVDRCAELLAPHLGLDLRELLFAAIDDGLLGQTAYTQPALFVTEYSLAQLWMAWGVRPQAMIGHSLGEYVAACLAGVLSLEDALALVAARGRMMQALPPGAMLAVMLPEHELQPFLGDQLALAAVNGPALCVASGPPDAVDELERALAERAVHCRRLHTSHAFHSAMMDPIVQPFAALVASVQLRAPRLPYVSNVTGKLITAAEATDPRYWARHLSGTVRFSAGLDELLASPDGVLLEIGPGQTLTTFARQHPRKTATTLALGSLRHPNDPQHDRAFALTTLARLWLAGTPLDGGALFPGERRRRELLPTYPFERQRYWIEPKGDRPAQVRHEVPDEKHSDLTDWFYTPLWKPSAEADTFEPVSLRARPLSWLLFAGPGGLGAGLARRLRELGQEVITVSAGQSYAKLSDDAYSISPRRREDYAALLADLAAAGRAWQLIAHLWSAELPGGGDELARCELAQERGFYSLLHLAQALGAQAATPAQIGIVTSQMQGVAGEPVRAPEQATILGPCLVIPQEYPHLGCRSIDLAPVALGSPEEDELVERLIGELASPSPDRVVAYRAGQRWVRQFEPIRLEASAEHPRRLREKGVYLISGGLGGIGLTLAAYLARTVRARLALTARSPFPTRQVWQSWLAAHSEQDPVGARIRQIQELEHLGAEVLVLQADVADPAQMGAAVAATVARFGALHGVIHAAGLLRSEPIQGKTVETAESVLLPKLQGTLALHAALRGRRLDWLVLCSSLTAAMGAIQTVDYSAANAFLDAFAGSAATQGTPTVAIAWDTWQGVGMALGGNTAPEIRKWREEELKKGIAPHEGVEVFSRVLHRRLSQVLVSTRDLRARIARSTALAASTDAMAGRAAQPAHPRPDLATPYVAPRDEQERALVRICQAVLGIEQVGIHDNFFELGCDSLIAIQFIAQIKTELDVQLSPVTLFEAPTISALVGHLTPPSAAAPAIEAAITSPAPEERNARAATRAELARRRTQARRG